MGGECRTYGETGVYRVLVRNLRERTNLEDPSIDESNNKIDLQEVGWGQGLD